MRILEKFCTKIFARDPARQWLFIVSWILLQAGRTVCPSCASAWIPSRNSMDVSRPRTAFSSDSEVEKRWKTTLPKTDGCVWQVSWSHRKMRKTTPIPSPNKQAQWIADWKLVFWTFSLALTCKVPFRAPGRCYSACWRSVAWQGLCEKNIWNEVNELDWLEKLGFRGSCRKSSFVTTTCNLAFLFQRLASTT